MSNTPTAGGVSTDLVEMTAGGYKVEKLTLNHGDILYLYTDGIDEAERLAAEILGLSPEHFATEDKKFVTGINCTPENAKEIMSSLLELAKRGSMRLMPPDYNLDKLREDYEHMQNMLFGVKPSFEEIMSCIAKLEEEIND